ncbi:MAG: SH3 domain-containing protein [Planctomycetota bacterium]
MIIFIIGFVLGIHPILDAEEAYLSGRFMEARALYSQALLEADPPLGPILYNVGNCAYRTGDYATALLYYSRAQLRMPRHKALRFNQCMAREQLGLIVASNETLGELLSSCIKAFTPFESLLCLGALQLIGLMGLVLFRKHLKTRVVMILLVLFAWIGASRLVYTQRIAEARRGIVLSSSIRLRHEPHTDLAVTGRLKAGEEVFIRGQSDLWIQVEHEGQVGWTERAGIGIIE